MRLRKSFITIILITSTLLNGCSMLAKIAKESINQAMKDPEQVTLDSIARPEMNSIELQVENWYLFHNERIYVYYYDYNDGDVFFSTNLKGRDKKVISNSEDMRLAEIQLIYNDWVYYYTTFNQGIKKVNINTGEIKNVLDDEYLHFIPDTLEDDKVLVTSLNNILGHSHIYFATLDLNTNSLFNEKKLEYISDIHYYSKKYDKVYTIDYDRDYNYTLYENGKSIYTYQGDINDNKFPFRTDEYIYILADSRLMKIDSITHELIEEKSLIDNNLKPYNSARDKGFQYKDGELNPSFQSTETPLFYKANKALKINEDIDVFDNKVYIFNESNMEFEVLSDGPRYGTVQEYGDYFVIQSHLNTTVINKVSKESFMYDSSHSYIDDGELYIMTFTGDFYYQKSNICNFEVVKVDLR